MRPCPALRSPDARKPSDIARGYLNRYSAFFVLNGDSVWTGSETLPKMSQFWDDSKMDALLLLTKRENAHGYQGKGDFFREATGQLSRCGAAPSAPYVFGGVHILHPRLLKNSPSGPFSLNLTWDKALEKGRLFGIPHEGEWFHIDTPDALKQYEPLVANLEMAKSKL